MSLDWASLFEMHVSAAELVVRGSLMYWVLFLVFRFVLKRDVGAVGIADILLLVLIADASQNAMAGGYDTVAEGLVLVGTLIGWNYLIDWAAFHWKAVRRFVEPPPPPLLLVRRGRLLHRNLRAEHLTLSEFKAHLRAHGLVSWHAVRAAYMESDGTFTVIKDESKADEGATTNRPPSRVRWRSADVRARARGRRVRSRARPGGRQASARTDTTNSPRGVRAAPDSLTA